MGSTVFGKDKDKLKIFQNYHRHSCESNIKISDSVVRNEDYAKRASELGHGIISTMEHGWQGRYIEGYELAKQHNLKFLFGTEAYWVKNRFEKDNTNAHICIFAQTENARQCINDILSEANITGFYYQPRIDLDLIYSLPKDEVWVTSACVAFWKYKDFNIAKQLSNHFGKNFYLEVQNHNTEKQIDLNKHILDLSSSHNIPLIMGCDSHYITQEKAWERDEYLASKGMFYEDEEGWFMDYPDGDTAIQRFKNQNVLSDKQIEEAIDNTNIFLNVCNYDNEIFNKEIKMPTIYGGLSQDGKDDKYEKLIWNQWDIEKNKVPTELHPMYVDEIKKEIEIVKTTKHSDYFLLDYELVKDAVAHGGLITDTGRGCFTEDALVHTKNTIKKIKDIEIGDEVVCSDGLFHLVTDTFNYKIDEELVQIKHLYGTRKYFPTICTKNHNILINRNGETDWVEAQYLRKGDFVCVPKMKNEEKLPKYIDLVDYNIFDYEYDNNYIYEYRPCKNNRYDYSPSQVARELNIGKSMVENFANGNPNSFSRKKTKLKEFYERYPFKTQSEYVEYIKTKRTIKINRYIYNDRIFNTFIGLMYGDGFNSKNGDVSIGLAINPQTSKDNYNRVIFNEIANRLGVSVYENRAKNRSLSQLYIYSSIFTKFIDDELFISKKYDKKQFNSKLFYQNIDNLNGIVDGLFFSDGSNSEKQRLSFDNTSLSLINAYKLLCLSTNRGVNSIVTRPKHRDNSGYMNSESYKLRLNPNAFNSKKIEERIFDDENYWYLPIKEILPIDKQKTTVYDICVEGKHDYLINNMIVHNSGVSFYTNKLLGFTKVDRIASPVKMYPERFMSATRILESKSLADLDLNLANPEVFMESQRRILGETHAYPMIAYGTMKAKSAWKMYAKAKNVDFDLANSVSDQIARYEEALKQITEDDDEISVYDYVDEEYHNILRDSENYLGIISDVKPHPCGNLIYQQDIRRNIGLIKTKSKSGGKEVLCTVMDGKWAEDYKFLKNDLLKVSVVELIKKTYERIGITPHDVNELIALTKDDSETWRIYEKGYVVGINQVEKNGTKHRMMQYKAKNISELCAFVAAIRPGFKSMYKIFANREEFDYGIPTFDKLIQTDDMPNSFMLYQEMAMNALNFAGVPMSECYDVIKNIAKKRAEKVLKYKKMFLDGFTEALIENEGKSQKEARAVADKIWQIISDSVRYSFNASHSFCVAMDSLYGAYLKSHYPLEFYEVLLNILDKKSGEKDRMNTAMSEAMDAFSIQFLPVMFGQDNRKFTIVQDKNMITRTIKSIKGFGESIADTLYEISKQEFSTFVDLLVYINENSLIGDSKVEALIKLNYFLPFGKNKRLLNIFTEFSSGKNRYNKKHTEKTKQKRLVELYEIEKNAVEECLPIKEQVDTETELLGCPMSIYPFPRGTSYILELDMKNSPKIKAFGLSTGKIVDLKVYKRDYNRKPFHVGDIVRFGKIQPKQKVTFAGNNEEGKPQFEPIAGERDLWSMEYTIMKNI